MADQMIFKGDKEFMQEVEDYKMEYGFNGMDDMGEGLSDGAWDWAKSHFEIQDQLAEYGPANNGE